MTENMGIAVTSSPVKKTDTLSPHKSVPRRIFQNLLIFLSLGNSLIMVWLPMAL